MADTLREALAERYETALRAICHGHTVGLGAAALANLARAALSGEAAVPLAPSPLLVDGRLSGESAVPLAQVTQTLVTQAKDLDPGFAAILEHHFDALLSRPAPALSRRPVEAERVTFYTPMLWVVLTEEQKYEEYIRVRQLLSGEVPPLRVEAPAQFAIGDTLVVHGYSPYWDGFEGRVIVAHVAGVYVLEGTKAGWTTTVRAGFDGCHLRRVEAPAPRDENEKDLGAGLIGQAIPDVAGTAPRPRFSVRCGTMHVYPVTGGRCACGANPWRDDIVSHPMVGSGNQPTQEQAASTRRSASAKDPINPVRSPHSPAQASLSVDAARSRAIAAAVNYADTENPGHGIDEPWEQFIVAIDALIAAVPSESQAERDANAVLQRTVNDQARRLVEQQAEITALTDARDLAWRNRDLLFEALQELRAAYFKAYDAP